MRIVSEQTLFSVSKPSLFSVIFFVRQQVCVVKPTTQLRMPLSKRLSRKHILPTELFEHWAPSIWQHFSFISMSDCVKHCIIHLPPQSLFFLHLVRFEELREFNVCVSLGLSMAICWNGLIYWICHIISVFYPEAVKYYFFIFFRCAVPLSTGRIQTICTDYIANHSS